MTTLVTDSGYFLRVHTSWDWANADISMQAHTETYGLPDCYWEGLIEATFFSVVSNITYIRDGVGILIALRVACPIRWLRSIG